MNKNHAKGNKKKWGGMGFLSPDERKKNLPTLLGKIKGGKAPKRTFPSQNRPHKKGV